MRIAFVTPEFVTDYPNGGGLGNYINRLARLLVEQGHDVEVFVSSNREPRVLTHEGIRVERVASDSTGIISLAMKAIARAAGFSGPFSLYVQSRGLAAAMENRHRKKPFDIVQSADYLAVGLCIGRQKGRVHIARCSTAADLYNRADRQTSREAKWRERLERVALRRADRVCSPSAFVAEHFRTQHRIPVNVVRPPISLDATPLAEVPSGLPDRFLIYFGQFARRKGVYWLSQALRRACEIEPSIRMVWVGRDYNNELEMILANCGQFCSRIQVRHPISKPELYAILQRAEAAVIPSLVDNLPNSVIECLMLGIPVIGTRGASIDELVEDGVTGELVWPGDVEKLALAMVRVWRAQSSVKRGFSWTSSIVDEMRPAAAIDNVLRLAAN